MAARSRPRAGQIKDDADEERSIWNQVRIDAKRVDTLMVEANRISQRIIELEEQQAGYLVRGELASAAIDDQLEKLYRESLRQAEETQSILDGDNNNLSVLKSLQLLAALRDASENDTSAARAASSSKSRLLKRKLDAHNAAEDSPADSSGVPSPKVSAGASAGRLMGKSSASRSGSVPAVREPSVKAEEGPESADGLKTPAGDKVRLVVGGEVFYRNKAKAAEGEGILCTITNVIGEGKQRRYEIQDADPDPPSPSLPYRASVSHLVPIPSANQLLAELAPRRQVLALYPGTTTFYKAEVVGVKAGAKELAPGWVRLRFEGEDEADREMDVERRYVLPEGSK